VKNHRGSRKAFRVGNDQQPNFIIMKKTFFATAVALLIGFGANAQIKIGAGFMGGLPMGDFGEVANLGIGGGVSGEYMVTDNIGAGLNVGFMMFGAKEEGFFDVTMIPIHLQGNYHFMPGEDFNFYGGLGLGINMTTVTTPDIDLGPLGTFPGSEVSSSEFAIVPRVGINYMFSDMLGLDFNTGYAIVGDYSYVPLNLGVIYVLD
jgi:hypothetical protein